MSYKRGDRVEFTVNNLGTTSVPHGGPKTVTDHLVNTGDIGTYLEPMPELETGWHVIAVYLDRLPIEYVPVHESMIRPASR